jgi:hypothetical protein
MAQAAALEGIKQRVEEQGGKIWEMETELENFLLENTGIQENSSTSFCPFTPSLHRCLVFYGEADKKIPLDLNLARPPSPYTNRFSLLHFKTSPIHPRGG